jgi:hypothetical protein
VILKRGKLELMLQSRASLSADVSELAGCGEAAILYLEVDDLGPIRSALGDWPRVVPERKTFYGATELIVHAPSGHVVFFSQHG